MARRSRILVGGGFVDRSENAPLAAELARQFTVYSYDRRGRGQSGGTLPYAADRELEDIEALIAVAGGSAHLYGASSDGALARRPRRRSSPVWPGLEALAHTLAYDAACMGNGRPPTARLATATRPTLVATGGASPDSFVGGGGDSSDQAADAIAASIPQGKRLTIEGQTHMVDPKVFAPVLERSSDNKASRTPSLISSRGRLT
jgi:hypothetical protein